MARDPSLSTLSRKRGDSQATVGEESENSFEQENFDPVEYLNGKLPSLTASAAGNAATRNRVQGAGRENTTGSLSSLSSSMHTLLSQLSVRSTTLSGEFTRATDEILRVGGRLEYEVDVLKGEVNGLHEILTEKLEADIQRFTQQPKGIEDEDGETEELDGLTDPRDAALPPVLAQLKMLLTVRNRLDAVVKIFGEETFAAEMARNRKMDRA